MISNHDMWHYQNLHTSKTCTYTYVYSIMHYIDGPNDERCVWYVCTLNYLMCKLCFVTCIHNDFDVNFRCPLSFCCTTIDNSHYTTCSDLQYFKYALLQLSIIFNAFHITSWSVELIYSLHWHNSNFYIILHAVMYQ